MQPAETANVFRFVHKNKGPPQLLRRPLTQPLAMAKILQVERDYHRMESL